MPLSLHTFFPFIKTLKDRLAESPIAYRLARGAFWSLIGGVASRLLTVISSIIVARFLGKEGYGEMGMVQSTMGMFGVLAGFGLGATATKYIAEFRYKDPVRAGRIVSLTLVVSIITAGIVMLVCFFVSPWLAEKTLNRPELSQLLIAGALLLFISTLGGVLSAILSGFESFREIAKINIWQGIAAPLLTIPLVWAYGVQGAITSFTINAAIGLLLCAVAINRDANKHSIVFGYSVAIWREWHVLWKYSLPLMIANLLVVPVTWITNTYLVNQPGGYGELGLFNAANQWRMLIIFLPALLTSAMLPVLSETHSRENKDDFIHTISLNLRGTWIVAFPMTVLVILMGKQLAQLFGKQFLGSEQMIAILMLACFLNVVNGAVGGALVGSGKIWIGTLMNIGWAIVMVGLSFMLIPRYGGTGLSISYLLAYLVHTIWQMAYVELKLAPKSISGQYKMLIFSATILIISLFASSYNGKLLILKSVLVVTSFFPLFSLFRNKYSKGLELSN